MKPPNSCETRMFDFLSSWIVWVVGLLGTLGYSGVFLLSFLDRLTVFFTPAEIILPAFGILVSQGVFGLWPVMAWVTIGGLLGNLGLYAIFRQGGRPFLESHGRYFLISKHELGHLDRWSSRYGSRILILGYLLPTTLRSLVPVVAGVARMDIRKFLIHTLIWSFPWNFIYVILGIKAGDHFETVIRYLEKLNYVLAAAILILVVWYWYRHRKGKHLTHE